LSRSNAGGCGLDAIGSNAFSDTAGADTAAGSSVSVATTGSSIACSASVAGSLRRQGSRQVRAGAASLVAAGGIASGNGSWDAPPASPSATGSTGGAGARTAIASTTPDGPAAEME
jgi:hypothetical protein